MTTLERRVRGLEHRLAELVGEKDEKFDQLVSDIADVRKDLKKILDLLQNTN